MSGLDWHLCEPAGKMVRFETIDLRKSMRTLGLLIWRPAATS
jgi:hypothetical protein